MALTQRPHAGSSYRRYWTKAPFNSPHTTGSTLTRMKAQAIRRPGTIRRMYYIIKHFVHLLTATNQHGVHSPFVYNYVTKCLYGKHDYSTKKSTTIFLRSIAYFKVKTLLFPTATEGLKKITLRKFPEVQFGLSPYDLIYTDASDIKNTETGLLSETKIHNDTMLFVDNIHKTKANEQAWRQLKKKEKVTVTIDLFHFGIVFFRKEQAREHFKIRI